MICRSVVVGLIGVFVTMVHVMTYCILLLYHKDPAFVDVRVRARILDYSFLWRLESPESTARIISNCYISCSFTKTVQLENEFSHGGRRTQPFWQLAVGRVLG